MKTVVHDWETGYAVIEGKNYPCIITVEAAFDDYGKSLALEAEDIGIKLSVPWDRMSHITEVLKR